MLEKYFVQKPWASDFNKSYYYKNGKVLDTYEKDALIEKVFDNEAYKAAMAEYYKKRSSMVQIFKKDISEDAGVPDKVVDVAFEMASTEKELFTSDFVSYFNDLIDFYHKVI